MFMDMINPQSNVGELSIHRPISTCINLRWKPRLVLSLQQGYLSLPHCAVWSVCSVEQCDVLPLSSMFDDQRDAITLHHVNIVSRQKGHKTSIQVDVWILLCRKFVSLNRERGCIIYCFEGCFVPVTSIYWHTYVQTETLVSLVLGLQGYRVLAPNLKQS